MFFSFLGLKGPRLLMNVASGGNLHIFATCARFVFYFSESSHFIHTYEKCAMLQTGAEERRRLGFTDMLVLICCSSGRQIDR